MATNLLSKFLAPEAQLAIANNIATTLPWGVLGGLFAVLYSMDAHPSRYFFGFAILHFAGVLPTPPIFKFLYNIYCSEGFGYKFIRPRLHARLPASHAEYFPAVRSLKKGNTFVCKNQKALSKEIRRLAEATAAAASGNNSSGDTSAADDALILPIPVLSDNYAYAIVYPPSSSSSSSANTSSSSAVQLECALVDAADPHRIVLELERQLILAGLPETGAAAAEKDDEDDDAENVDKKKKTVTATAADAAGTARRITLNIAHILTTHKHWDHAGGNKEFLEMSSSSSSLLMPSDLRRELVEKVNAIETERRRTERKRQMLVRKNTPKAETAIDVETLQTVAVVQEAEISDDTDDEGMSGGAMTGVGVGVKTEKTQQQQTRSAIAEKREKKIAADPYRYFYAEADEKKVSGLITFAKNLPFVGSKTDNPHCTNTFVANFDKIHLGASRSKLSSASSPLATITVMDAPGHTCGSVMFLLSFADAVEKSLFENEKENMVNKNKDNNNTAGGGAGSSASSSSLQMAHTIHRALFTGDCIFCGGCGAMFETKTAADTLQTYDCFMGSALTAFPLKRSAAAVAAANATADGQMKKTSATAAVAQSTDAPTTADFFVSSRNVMMFVGHEYTLKLMSGLMEMVLGTKDKLIKDSEAEAKKEIEEKKRRGEVDADGNVIVAPPIDERQDITTVALDEIIAEAAAKSGNHDSVYNKKPAAKLAGVPAKPRKVLMMRPHHAAIEERWAQIMKVQQAYHPNAATVPSSLYEERRTNPLLTLERSVLVKLNAINAHASRIEEEVYGSDERRTKL